MLILNSDWCYVFPDGLLLGLYGWSTSGSEMYARSLGIEEQNLILGRRDELLFGVLMSYRAVKASVLRQEKINGDSLERAIVKNIENGFRSRSQFFLFFFYIKHDADLIDRYLLRELLIPSFFLPWQEVLAFLSDLRPLLLHGESAPRNEPGSRTGVLLYSLATVPQLPLVLDLAAGLLSGALLYANFHHSAIMIAGVAIRAPCGVNIWRICAPYLVVGCALGALLPFT
jgi:hypothetical protein